MPALCLPGAPGSIFYLGLGFVSGVRRLAAAFTVEAPSMDDFLAGRLAEIVIPNPRPTRVRDLLLPL
jgi:hypothetical protein